MIIKDKVQLPFPHLKDIDVDLFIAASGYESRSTFIAKQLQKYSIQRKIVFKFIDENSVSARRLNDAYFENDGYEQIDVDGDSNVEVRRFFNGVNWTSKFNWNIVVDYSVMTRVWYSAILEFIKCYNSAPITINFYFCYSISSFASSPKMDSYNIHIGPIRGFSNLTVPQKPTALIIGLGYERNRAIGLSEYLDGETFVFYTDRSKEEKYSIEVENNNKELIKQLKPNNIWKYPINDLNYLYRKLYTLCLDLADKFRVIIAPCGPKPFSLISLLVALDLENIDVWRISPGKSAPAIDKKAEGEVTMFFVSTSAS